MCLSLANVLVECEVLACRPELQTLSRIFPLVMQVMNLGMRV